MTVYRAALAHVRLLLGITALGIVATILRARAAPGAPAEEH